MFRFACLLVVVMLPVASAAQDHLSHGASGLPHGIPDFCAMASERVMVPAGQVRTISGTFETSCLGVHGTLMVASDTKLRVDELLIYADGAVTIGSASQPATGVEIVIRDRPVDLVRDPEQYGQGIIGFGRVSLYGAAVTGPTRTIVIRSENPQGTRGHVLLTQRADVDIRYAAFLDMGRTSALRPLDSTTFTGEIATHTGTNQIGRYSLHLHHLMGPPPNSGRSRQFYVIGNLIDRDSKWGIVLHNTHFGLVQDNTCVNGIGACYVEEDGSETDNHWIGNYAGQLSNPSVPDDCINFGYDPEGRCASGFWLRGTNQVLRNNVVEDARLGIGWWTRCLEVVGQETCSSERPVTIPLFPGANTTDPAQIKNDCRSGEGRTVPCLIVHRVGLDVDGNVIRRAHIGLSHWWTVRVQNGSVPITNTRMENVQRPIHQAYSDVAYDGVVALNATYTGVGVRIENDGQPQGMGIGRSALRHAEFRGYEYCWQIAGQQDQPPLWTIADSVLQCAKGIHIQHGGQGYGDTQDFQITNVKFEAPPGGPLVAFTVGSRPEAVPGQRIITTVTQFQGGSDGFVIVTPNEASPCKSTRSEVVGGFTCPPGSGPAVPTPEPAPAPQPGGNAPVPPATPGKPCRFPPELGLCS